jgi:hypothetical protein
MAQLFEALRYKPEGRGFDSRTVQPVVSRHTDWATRKSYITKHQTSQDKMLYSPNLNIAHQLI